MKGSKKKTILLLFTVFIVIAFFKIDAYAAPNSVNIPEVNVSIGDGNNTPQDYVSSIKILSGSRQGACRHSPNRDRGRGRPRRVPRVRLGWRLNNF